MVGEMVQNSEALQTFTFTFTDTMIHMHGPKYTSHNSVPSSTINRENFILYPGLHVRLHKRWPTGRPGVCFLPYSIFWMNVGVSGWSQLQFKINCPDQVKSPYNRLPKNRAICSGKSIFLTKSNTGLSIGAGSRPKQPATDQPLAGYFHLILLLILVRNLK